MAGLAAGRRPRDTLLGAMRNLAWAARAPRPGVKPVIEPINHRDIPGFFLNTTDQARDHQAVGRSRSDAFDLYHCQITEGDLVKRVGAHLPLIAHMQVPTTRPQRARHRRGELAFVFGRSTHGFRGWIGCEYRRPARPRPASAGSRPTEAPRPRRTQTSKIGFIGLGIMGRPWRHLKAAGTRSSCRAGRLPARSRAAFDVRRRAAAVASSRGRHPHGPDTPDVEAVLFGPGGVAEG
jgi:hypothetical protein